MDNEQAFPVPHGDLLVLTTDIVSAYLSKNSLALSDLPPFMGSVFGALRGLGITSTVIEADVLKPAVPIRRSVTPDYLVCLEDGKKMKMLKRHLRTAYNMSPEQYRERWNLPADYPMVAPNYAEMRRTLAKKIGLGRSSGAGRMKKGIRRTAKSVL
jgi:predicted transcriptional regulator